MKYEEAKIGTLILHDHGYIGHIVKLLGRGTVLINPDDPILKNMFPKGIKARVEEIQEYKFKNK